MKKTFSVLLFSFSITCCRAQQNNASTIFIPQGKKNMISLGAEFPLGEFAGTHLPGAAFVYERTSARVTVSLRHPKLPKYAFVYGGSVAGFAGRRESISNSDPYKYPAYILASAFAGISYSPVKNFNGKLSIGPALGFYDHNTRFNIDGRIDLRYFFKGRWSAGPGLHFTKETGAASFAIATLQIGYSF